MIRVFHPEEHGLPDRIDAFVTVLGFESRSLHAARAYLERCESRFAVVFAERNVLEYKANEAWLTDNDFALLDSIGDLIAALEHLDLDGTARVVVDISSMSRPMIADVISAMIRWGRSVVIDFLYSPASFSAPPPLGAPQIYSGPVTPEFAGWTVSPELPLAAVIGLGYERGRALGVLEYLEPSVAWIFTPTVRDGIEDQPRFDEAIKATNVELLELVPEDQYLSYDVSAPFQCFESLESLVYGLSSKARVLLAPFGPKIFALIALLVAEQHKPHVTVWRVSGGQSEDAELHPATGPIYRLPVAFGPAALL